MDNFVNTVVVMVGKANTSAPANISTGHSNYDCCEMCGLAHKSNHMDTCTRNQDRANPPL